MKTAIILHGMPSKEVYFNPERASESNSHWLPWLQRQLLLKGILAQTPELPEPFRPDYENWKKVFEKFSPDEETILVGHSCGGGFLVRWLSENKVEVGRVALVAPWISPSDSRPAPGFFNFVLDRDLASRTKKVRLFISSDDEKEELQTSQMLQREIKDLEVNNFTDRGHFTFGDMNTVEFPELLHYLAS